MMIKQWILGLLFLLVVAVPAIAVEKRQTPKAALKVTRPVAKVVAPVMPEPEAETPTVLSSEQLDIAKKVLVGTIQCELAVKLVMTRDAQSDGRFWLEAAHKRYRLEPVVTSTGAVRLEEASTGAVWLQLANKSMLMNQKEGRRMADDCMNPDQLLVAQALARNPVPSLLDAPKAALVPVGAGGAVEELVPNAEAEK